MSARELEIAKREAEDALDVYAQMAFGWNEPDDEYTRQSLRLMVERAIKTHDPSALASPVPGDALAEETGS